MAQTDETLTIHNEKRWKLHEVSVFNGPTFGPLADLLFSVSKRMINDPCKSVDLGEMCAFSSVFTAAGVDLQCGGVFVLLENPAEWYFSCNPWPLKIQ